MDSMKLQMSGQMRMEQRLKLAPHMIASMEILQLPMMALKERIEQELSSNPTLETDQAKQSETSAEDSAEDTAIHTIEMETEKENAAEKIRASDENLSEYFDQPETYRFRNGADETDKKMEALKNTQAPSATLHDYLDEQWGLSMRRRRLKRPARC